MTTTNEYKKWVWLIHGLFWLLLFLLVAIVMHAIVESVQKSAVAAIVNISGWMILVYVHFDFLVPRYFETRRYKAYSFSVLILMVLATSWRFFIGFGLVEALGWELSHEFNRSYWGAMFIDGMFILFLSIPLQLIENWIKRQELEKELKTQQLEAELRFLKAQVNPHFLFNALNNIYSLSFTESKKTPEMILKLSDMMSYMLYDCKGEKVKLESELNYLKNYIALQQLKKDGEQHIELKIDGESANIQVTPMLFIPFFENAFKHGNLEDTQNGWLKSTFQINPDSLNFTIQNSLDEQKRKNKLGGVGLENVKRRLELLYPEKHQLKINKGKEIFEVHLEIEF